MNCCPAFATLTRALHGAPYTTASPRLSSTPFLTIPTLLITFSHRRRSCRSSLYVSFALLQSKLRHSFRYYYHSFGIVHPLSLSALLVEQPLQLRSSYLHLQFRHRSHGGRVPTATTLVIGYYTTYDQLRTILINQILPRIRRAKWIQSCILNLPLRRP